MATDGIPFPSSPLLLRPVDSTSSYRFCPSLFCILIRPHSHFTAQIKFLINDLEKKNQSASFAELNELVSLYGQDAQIFLLTCLIDQIDFRESKTQPKSGAAAKVCFLKSFFFMVYLMKNTLCFDTIFRFFFSAFSFRIVARVVDTGGNPGCEAPKFC